MKTERIFLRVSTETKKYISKKAQEHNTSMSDYIIKLIKNKTIKVQALPDKNALELKKELAHIGKNIWTLIKYNKSLKLSEKLDFHILIEELKVTSQKISKYYDC